MTLNSAPCSYVTLFNFHANLQPLRSPAHAAAAGPLPQGRCRLVALSLRLFISHSSPETTESSRAFLWRPRTRNGPLSRVLGESRWEEELILLNVRLGGKINVLAANTRCTRQHTPTACERSRGQRSPRFVAMIKVKCIWV